MNIRSTFGYFGSTLGYVESTLYYIESTLGHGGSTLVHSGSTWGMLGVFVHTNIFCLKKVKTAVFW